MWSDLSVVKPNVPLAPYTWLKIGGPAEYFAEPDTQGQLSEIVKRCKENDVPVRMLGSGSNLLVADGGVPGMVLRLTGDAFGKIEFQGDHVTAGAAAPLGSVVTQAVREGLAGLEEVIGIPGTVGGALHGNAGAGGGDVGRWTESVTTMSKSGQVAQRAREELRFAYRSSNIDELAILSVTFALERDDPEELTRRMQKMWIVKQSEQPQAKRPVAWMFTDPRGMSAGELIEQAGLKGAGVGGAEVDNRHPNYVVASQGAASSDVVRLMELIENRVSERLGVQLERALEVW